MDDSSKRPTIQQVVLSLKSIIFQEHHDEISSIVHAKNEELPKENFSDSISTIDDEFDDLFISDYLLNYNLDMNNEITPYILKQAEKLFNEMYDLTDTNIEIVIDKLIMILIEIQDKKGYNFMETNQIISQCIFLSNLTQSNISNWLINNQTKSQLLNIFSFLVFFIIMVLLL